MRRTNPPSSAIAWLVLGLIPALLLIPATMLAESPGNPDSGKELYQERCVLCHGAVGRGWDWSKKVVRPPVPVPDLLEVVPQRTDDYLMAVIRDGGQAVGLTRFMPAFGFNMSQQELRDVVAYLRSLQRRAQ